MWFLRHAEIREKYLQVHKKKSFTFTLNDILPVEERAFLILYKRYGNEVDPQLGSIPSRVMSSSSPTRLRDDQISLHSSYSYAYCVSNEFDYIIFSFLFVFLSIC
jgi:hypothetical protein